jgi:hypothetical protein
MNKLTALCAAAIILCHAALAQPFSDRVTVRFTSPVLVGETKLPAGTCDIQVIRGNTDNTILVFRSEGGVSAAAVASRISPADTDESATSVVLNRRGADLHLYRVMLADHVGYELNSVE